MKSEFLISGIETGKLNAMVKNIMVQTQIEDPREAVQMMNSGKLKVTIIESGRFSNNKLIIETTLRSPGRDGKGWLKWFKENDIQVHKDASSILLLSNYTPSNEEVKIVILRGHIFNDWERNWGSVTELAQKMSLKFATPEMICLLRERYTNEDFKNMRLDYIYGMHKPIKSSEDKLSILALAPAGVLMDQRGVHVVDANPGKRNWTEDVNYLFIEKD